MDGRHHARRANHRNKQQLPLDTARQCFTWLVTGPNPLSLDGRAFPGLPERQVPLDEVLELMLRRRCSHHTRDAIWAHLVQRSRDEGATWTLACVGMAVPALASASRWLASRYPGDALDIHAEVLSGYLHALAHVDLSRPRVLVRLRWAAYRAGHAALAEALDAPTPVATGFHSAAPRPPWGHPDLVLARAVRKSVLTPTEADLIGATRLDETPITDWATAHGTTAGAAYKARRRAERRLLAFIRDQTLDVDPDDPVVAYVFADSLPYSGSTSRPPSRSVKSDSGDGKKGVQGKAPGSVSKTQPPDGFLGCGGTPPTAPSSPSSEVPPCA